MSRKINPLEGIEELREASKGRSKFTLVNRAHYFWLLVAYDEQALDDKQSYEAWMNYHTGRGESRKVRSLHVKKLLESHDERGRY